MHSGPERAAWATEAEAEAPSSAMSQVAAHYRHVPCSISGLKYVRDSDTAVISERRSMPFLHMPASRPFKRDRFGGNASTSERPVSPTSTVSSRRSVSSMKQLLQLRLQPTPTQPKIDLASWLDDTASSLQPPIESRFEKERREKITADSPVPWISCLQDVRLSPGLPPDRYRETPVYSGPGSPTLSRAYFSREELCYHYSPKSSVCDELCIVSDFEDAETTSPYSAESFVDCANSFDTDKSGCIDTSVTSFASSQISKLSTRCHADYVQPEVATWMKSSLRCWIEDGPQELAYTAGIDGAEQEQSILEGWLDSESSRSGSSFTSDEVLDALVTKLAPARAHVVELSKVFPVLPLLTNHTKSSLLERPATPYRLSRRRRSVVNYPLLRLKRDALDDGTGRQGELRREISSSSLVSDLQWEHALHGTPSSSIPNTSFSDFGLSLVAHQSGSSNLDSVEPRINITDAIYDVVQGFPQQMFFLDTPCIVDIRQKNQLIQHETDPQRSPHPSPNASTGSLALDRLRHPSRRRRAATDFFTPFLRATARKSSLLQKKATPLSTTRPSTAIRPSSSMSEGWKSLASRSDTSLADLSLFRHIFPDTQDWWRRVLYAHLLAFNYIRESKSPPPLLPPPPPPPPRPSSEVPSKACQTLGISYKIPSRSIPIANTNARLASLEEDLVSCITCIANCMVGRSGDLKKLDRDSYFGKRDYILARSLAEIVKVSERSAEKDAEGTRLM